MVKSTNMQRYLPASFSARSAQFFAWTGMPTLLLYSALSNAFAPKEGYDELRPSYFIWFAGGLLVYAYALAAPILALIVGDYVNTAPSREPNNLWFRATVIGTAISLIGFALFLTSR